MTKNSGTPTAGTPAAAAERPGIAPAGFRSPPETTVGRVCLQVSDLERSIGFYRDLLGFRLLAHGENSAALGPQPGPEAVETPDRVQQEAKRQQTEQEEQGEQPERGKQGKKVVAAPLIELTERPGAAPVPARGRLGLFHFAVLLPDRTSLGRMLTHLGDSEVRIGSSDHLVSEALYLSDPDGLGIEIYADRPRSAWRAHGREIAMATEPLDARGLVAAGADAPWSGIPTGSTIGHVHLSVGDLEEAKSFFHHGLGLDVMVWGYPGALFFAAGGYHHHVGTNTWARGAAPAGEGDARLLEWRLVFPDADAVSDALQSVADAGFADALDRSGGRVTDPWGTRVRLDTDA